MQNNSYGVQFFYNYVQCRISLFIGGDTTLRLLSVFVLAHTNIVIPCDLHCQFKSGYDLASPVVIVKT